MKLGKILFKTREFVISVACLSMFCISSSNAVPNLTIDTELYHDTVSEDINGNEINFDFFQVNSSVTNADAGEVFSRSNSIASDLQGEEFESLYAESIVSLTLDASSSSSYEVLMNFIYTENSSSNAETFKLGSIIDNIETDLSLSIPSIKQYIFQISPGETKEFLWFYEIVGATSDFFLSADSSLQITSIKEVVSQVPEPGSLALILGGLGLLISRRK